MAKREALRELQNRLAQRLQAALTELPSSSWLAVHCGGLGLIFAVWMIVLGVALLMLAIIGWMFEYYRGDFAQ